jgi:hypothetical protein
MEKADRDCCGLCEHFCLRARKHPDGHTIYRGAECHKDEPVPMKFFFWIRRYPKVEAAGHCDEFLRRVPKVGEGEPSRRFIERVGRILSA